MKSLLLQARGTHSPSSLSVGPELAELGTEVGTVCGQRLALVPSQAAQCCPSVCSPVASPSIS